MKRSYIVSSNFQQRVLFFAGNERPPLSQIPLLPARTSLAACARYLVA